MKYDENGLPLFTMKEKIKALEYCLLENDGNEDAVGHIRDILYHIDVNGIFMKNSLQYPPVKIIEEYLK